MMEIGKRAETGALPQHDLNEESIVYGEARAEEVPRLSKSGLSRTKTVYEMTSHASLISSASTFSESDSSSTDVDPLQFASAVHDYTGGTPFVPQFDHGMRKVMEPYLRRARRLREKTRNTTSLKVHASIARSVGVPYTALRQEVPFIYDTHTHRLHEVLAEVLQVKDLSKVHEFPRQDLLLAPLLDGERRQAFHVAYDSFVRSFCIPLLYELAMSKKIYHTSSSADCITYRYQAFPTIHIHRPKSSSPQSTTSPTCDVSGGHSMGCLRFHVPLTPSFGANALYTESFPGREDWHPLPAKSVGLGYLFDGARCLHFDLKNTTNASRVSLEFRILMYRKSKHHHGPHADEVFTPPDLVEDSLSRAGPGYYNETCIDWTHFPASCDQGNEQPTLWTPDARCGPPFDA